MGNYKQILAIALAAGLGIAASGAASAQGMQQGGMGPGMMGYGQAGMGPGMMMGYGQGGMGPGMMGYGQHGMGPGMMGGGPPGMLPCPLMAEGMGMMHRLEPEQRSEMRELIQQHRPAQFERMGKMMDLRLELVEAMHAESPDPEQVERLHGQMGELQGEMMAEMVRMRGKMLDLLTDEQREQLKQGAASPADPQ